MSKIVKLGGASGYWGESDMAWGQFLGEDAPALDYIVFDYLAEITMSIMAKMRARNPDAGYAPDFVANLTKWLPQIADKGVKICSNAGGVNPGACADAVRKAVAEAGLNLNVAVVTGDDFMDRLGDLDKAKEMFTGETFPDPETIVSANAYLGAFPVAEALSKGADIVITGRCVDSAVTLGALIHEFGWQADDLDKLAQGSLVGHLIECGPQVTGGNFTDWASVADTLVDVGYPIAEVEADGAAIITKPTGTGGVVNRGTVSEQMLYEIGDPCAYYLPDVVCDFTDVVIEDLGGDRVRASGAKGRGVPDSYKASVTVADGHRLSAMFFMVGEDAPEKARIFYEATMTRTRRKLRDRNMADYRQTELELTGNGFHFGEDRPSDELAFRISVRHDEPSACTLMLKEASGFALAMPPGFALFSGARPKPQAVVRLFSTLVDKDIVDVSINGEAFTPPTVTTGSLLNVSRETPATPDMPADTDVPLVQLAWLRSGDKGDKSNIGVIARDPKFMPYIWAALDEGTLAAHFDHFVDGKIERWYLPGSHSLNILMDEALGGGGMASLRNDSQGKSFGQVLARLPIPVPADLL